MKRITLGVVVGLVASGAGALAFVLLRPPPVEVVEVPGPPEPPASELTNAVEPPPVAPPVTVTGDPDVLAHLLQPPARPAAVITPDGRQVVVAVEEYRDFFQCEFSGLVWRDLNTGAEVKRLDLRKHLDPASVDRKPGPHGEENHLEYRRLLFTAGGKLIVAGGIRWPDPRKMVSHFEKTYSSVSSTRLVTAECYSATGFLWLIDPDTGKVEKTLVRDRVDFVCDIDLSRDGAKLFVRMPLPPRTRNHPLTPSEDPPFVEVQQWDTTTWTRDWVKMVEPAEAEKVRAGR